MRTFRNIPEAVSTDLLLWQKPSTDVSIDNTYELKIYPREVFHGNAPANFSIPPQPQGMLQGVDIVTSFELYNGDTKAANTDNVSIINNFTNSLWGLVDVKVSDRVDIMQSMRNSYAYTTYFDTILNTDPNRLDKLRKDQIFIMDSGVSKADADDVTFAGITEDYGIDYDDLDVYVDEGGEVEEGEAVQKKKIARQAQNVAGIKRRRATFEEATVVSKLHCPLLNTHKVLPTNMNVFVSLTKNEDKFLILSAASTYSVKVTDVYLIARYLRPSEVFLNPVEERLAKEAAPYFTTKPEIIVKPVGSQGKHIRMNNLFTDNKIPNHAFFALQFTQDFEGSYSGNPFAFLPMTRFQIHLDGKPYFADPISTEPYSSNGKSVYDKHGKFLRQLYSSIGKSDRGACLINSLNFQQNFIVGVSFQPGRNGESLHGYLSPQLVSSTNLEIDLQEAHKKDVVLIIYAVYDRLVKIHGDRSVEIIE